MHRQWPLRVMSKGIPGKNVLADSENLFDAWQKSSTMLVQLNVIIFLARIAKYTIMLLFRVLLLIKIMLFYSTIIY